MAPGLVARVADQPIYKVDYDHWSVIAQKSTGSGDDEELRTMVMQLLLSFKWIDVEARRLGVTVSAGAVDAHYRKHKREAFPKESDFEEFIATSGQTVADIKLRVRQDLLSNKLRERAVGDAKTAKGQQRRLDRYVRQFASRSRRMTACGTGYYNRRDCVKEVPLSA